MTRSSSAVIAGIDEAGRGALAGPVVAAACVLNAVSLHPLIRDSKQLTPEEREEAFCWIASHCAYGIGLVEAQDIDKNGILAATEKAMQIAVRELSEIMEPTYLLVDGRDKFWFNLPHSSLIRGDEIEPCISAASIVAKVTRDRLMTEYARKWPTFGFDDHKGYGVPQHLEAIRQHGASPLHRQTFLRNLFASITPAAATTTRAERRRGRVAP
ncbi:MAG: ribonuclease HII [Candidatus Peribacteraceae bacterium]|nr:ribonuclease HII [Candidatus Peribacteraceae bacterium]